MCKAYIFLIVFSIPQFMPIGISVESTLWHKFHTMMRNRLVMMSELATKLESEAMNCTLMTCHLATI